MDKEAMVEKDKQLLQEIVNSDEFRVYQGQEQQNPLEKWVDRLLTWLQEQFNLPDVPDGSGSVVSYAIIALALGALLVLIIWMVRRSIQTYQRKHTLLLPEEEGNSYLEYLRLAKRQQETRDWNEGVRYAFIALLFYLQERGWIKVEKWKTNWEYRDELLQYNPSWSPFFQAQAHLFERIWYGRKMADEHSFRQYIEDLERKLQGEEQDERSN